MQMTFTIVVSLSRQSIKNFAYIRRIPNEGAAFVLTTDPNHLQGDSLITISVSFSGHKCGSIVNSGCHMHCLFFGKRFVGSAVKLTETHVDSL